MKEDELTKEQKDLLAFHSKLFQWRQKERVIHQGKTRHFYTENNTYAFFRYNKDEALFVFVNASPEEVEVPVDHYQEMLDVYGTMGVQPLEEKPIILKKGMKVKGLSYLIVKLDRNATPEMIFREKVAF